MSRLLIVDDEFDMLLLLKEYFEESYEVITAINGEDAIRQLTQDIDLILLDINLPDMDGFEVCTRIREQTLAPILFLTARADEADRIIGLNIGGDDYIVKPFSFEELAARVSAHLRRQQRNQQNLDIARYSDGLEINYNSRQIMFNGNEIHLKNKEFELVAFLSRNPGQAMTRIQIFNYLWDESSDTEPEVIMTYVSGIRGRFSEAGAKDRIKTVWGYGYKWQN